MSTPKESFYLVGVEVYPDPDCAGSGAFFRVSTPIAQWAVLSDPARSMSRLVDVLDHLGDLRNRGFDVRRLGVSDIAFRSLLSAVRETEEVTQVPQMPKCECGAAQVGSGIHSTWCALVIRNAKVVWS